MEQLVSELYDNNIILVNGKTNKNVARILEKAPTIKDQILKRTEFLDSDCTFGERVYVIKHNISSPVICSNAVCNKHVKYVPKTGYNRFCSLKCSANSVSVREKTSSTNLTRYGSECSLNNEQVLKKAVSTRVKKYGVPHVLQNPVIKTKQQKTMMEKYGVPNYNYINKQIPIELTDYDWLKNQHHDLGKSLTQIARDLNVDPTTVSRYASDVNLHIKHTFSSTGQTELTEWLRQNRDLMIFENDRTLIPPYEIDIYVPESKLAIEYCGLFWHSDIHNRINRNYHKNKYTLCADKEVKLLTIFEDEWKFTKDIVKRTILHKLRMDTDRVHARKCEIRSVTNQTRRVFLEEHHIQGDGRGSVNLGLFFNDTIVAVMTFIRQSSGVFTLNRFATSVGVVGGFSKLLKHFCKTFDWNKIETFADLRWSSGELYSNQGFTIDNVLPPEYRYVVGDRRVHKFNFRRRHLDKRLKDFDPSLSEQQNCINNGLGRVWDCGLIKFIMENK